LTVAVLEYNFSPGKFHQLVVKITTTYVDRDTAEEVTLRPGVYYVWWCQGNLTIRRWR